MYKRQIHTRTYRTYLHCQLPKTIQLYEHSHKIEYDIPSVDHYVITPLLSGNSKEKYIDNADSANAKQCVRAVSLWKVHEKISRLPFFCRMYTSIGILFVLWSGNVCLLLCFAFFVFHFRSSCFSGGVFCCALVPGTLALDLPRTLILSQVLFFLCLTVCDHIICTSKNLSRMKNQEGYWGYCWCWVERTV